MGAPSSSRLIRFGLFEVDLASGEVHKQGRKLKLQEQPFRVLAALLEKPGEVVTREELRQRIWSDDTFVDFDHSLSKAINKVRAVLGDSARNPRYVETLPQRGYRFIAEVATGGGAPLPDVRVPSDTPPRGRHLTRAAALLLVAATLALLTWHFARRHGGLEPLPSPVPLTSYPGQELAPSFSTDGSRIAFSWQRGAEENWDIHVKLIGEETNLRLTEDPAVDYNPVWSPDDRYIAFLRGLPGDRWAVMLIPSIGGGTERKVGEVEGLSTALGFFWRGYLAWSPDGKWLVVPHRPTREDRVSLFLLSIDSGQIRRLTSPPADSGDADPCFAPDGRTLAFVRGSSAYFSSDLHLLPLADNYTPAGETIRLDVGLQAVMNPVWTPDGREIVLSSMGDSVANHTSSSLWRVPATGKGKPQRLAGAGEQGRFPALSRDGRRLAYVRSTTVPADVWRLELSGPGNPAAPPVKFIFSTQGDSNPQYSPDGSKIAFASDRTGAFEIWLCEADGSGLRPLTSLGAYSASPSWSPDGERIAFHSNPEGQFDIHVVDLEGGQPERVTVGATNESRPSWSLDGKWIYFKSGRSGEDQVWKKPAKSPFETAAAIRVTDNGGHDQWESSDGKFLYYLKGDSRPYSLWRCPTSGGRETQVLGTVLHNWMYAVADEGVYFFGENWHSIQYHGFATGQTKVLLTSEDVLTLGLTASPDGRWLLYSHRRLEADLMLVENFR